MHHIKSSSWYPDWIGPVFLGMAVPASAFGPVAMAAAAGIAFLAIAPRLDWRRVGRAIRQLASSSAIARGLVALFGVWMLSTALSIDPAKSSSTLFRMIAFLLVAFALYRYLAARPRALSMFLRSLLVSMLVVLTYIDLTLYVWPPLIEFVSAIKGKPLYWYSFFKGHASVVAVAVFCVLWAGYREKGGWRVVAATVALLGGLLIYARGEQTSLSAFAGVCGGVTLAAGILALRSLPRRVAQVGAALCVVSAIALLWLGVSALPPIDRQVETTAIPLVDLHRQYIWSFVIHQIPENPVFGSGINAVNLVAGAEANVPGMGQEFVPSHPHNWMVEVAAETGLVGLTMLLVCQLVFVNRAATLISGDRWAALAAIASFGAFWVSGLFNFSIWTSWWQVALLIILIGPLAAASADGPPSRTASNGSTESGAGERK